MRSPLLFKVIPVLFLFAVACGGKPEVVEPAIECLVSGLAPDKASQVGTILSHDATEKQIKGFTI